MAKRAFLSKVMIGALLAACAIPASVAIGAQQRMSAQQVADAWIGEHAQDAISLSDDIWHYAEPPFQEYRSADRIRAELEKAGFKIQNDIAGMPTSMVASFSVGSGKPIIGIVAEYDTPVALGFSQKGGVPYREEAVRGDYGHACGHNMIAGSSVAAAIAIKEAMVRSGTSGTIKFFGTPAEEVLTGKVYMADAGVFNDLDAAIAWHPGPNFEPRYGISPAMDRVKFSFVGKSSQAAAEAMRLFIAFDPEAEVELHREMAIVKVATVGATREESVQKMDKLRAEARTIARETDTSFDEQYVVGIRPRLVNMGMVRLMDRVMHQYTAVHYSPEDQRLAEEISKTFDRQLPADQLLPRLMPPHDRAGSANDNSEVSWITPFISVHGGVYVNGVKSHSWQQTALASSSIGHKGLVVMTHVMARAALDLMTKPAELASIRTEFQQKTAGFTYHANLPKEKNWRAAYMK